MRSGRFRSSTGALLVAIATAVAGCAPMRVSAHVDSHVDFTKLKTFAWGPADALPAGDPRLDASGFFQDHMQGAVERQMLLKGYAHAGEHDTPDLRIHFHAVIRDRLNVDAFDARRGFCSGACVTPVNEFQEGTLIVDVMDARSNRLIWRGWAQESLGNTLESQDKLVTRIDRAVHGLMRALPARPVDK